MSELLGIGGVAIALVGLILQVRHRRRLGAPDRGDEPAISDGEADVIVELLPSRVRLRNVGPAPARDLTVRFPPAERVHMRVDAPTEPLPVLMPGQHVDFVGVRTHMTPPLIAVTVRWVDDTGSHEEVIPVSTLNDGITAVG